MALFIAVVATRAVADWPPPELAGAWRVTWTSEENRPDAADTEMLLLVKDYLILVAHAGPIPYAYGYALSEGSANEETYRALLHMPTVALLPDGGRRNDVSKDPVVFSTKRADNGLSHVTVELSEPPVQFRATRMSKQAASNRIEAILETPGFHCSRRIRRLVEGYVTATP